MGESFDDDYDDDPRHGPTEMDRFTDEELASLFNDPAAGGVLREYLKPILSRMPGSAIDEADKAVALMKNRVAPDAADPLFFDWKFLYVFVSAERFLKMTRDRFKGCTSDPFSFLSIPAFALLSHDCQSEAWSDVPTPAWLRAADAVKWDGVLPADRVYAVGQDSRTAMVALKFSPIWRRLGYAGPRDGEHEPYPFRRDGNRPEFVVGVGRRELARLCEMHGIPDPMPEVESFARRMRRR